MIDAVRNSPPQSSSLMWELARRIASSVIRSQLNIGLNQEGWT